MEISVNGQKLNIPDDMSKAEDAAELFPGASEAYSYSGGQTLCCLSAQTFSRDEEIPYNDKAGAAAAFRRTMKDDTGILRAETGVTDGGHRFVYVLSKKVSGDKYLRYMLMLMMELDSAPVLVTGVSDETALHCFRTATVRREAQKKGWIGSGGEGWKADPYDPGYTKGCLMNISENECYDEKFPEQALSVLRRALKYLLENN